jgi:MFS transporter, AAHS family, 4-hydroxybenzoate transporter
MKPAAALDVRQFIDEQPVRSYQILVATICALIVFVDGFDAQAMGYVAPALTADLRIPRSVLGSVISSGLVGMMAGALVFGPVADRIGRKPVLVISALTFGIGSLLTATATTVQSLVVLRVLTGIGLGGAMPNAIALTSEYMPQRSRATGVIVMMCGFSSGAAVGGFIAAALIPQFGWRSVFIAGGIGPIVIAFAAMVWLPESIRFLLLRGGAATRVSDYLRRIAPTADIPPVLSAGVDEHTRGHGLVRQLFDEHRAVTTILIWVVYFMNLLNVYFLNSWLPTIMTDVGIGEGTAIRVTSLFQVGGIVGALVLGKILDRRRSFGVLAVCFAWAAAWILATGQVGASVPLLALTVFCAGIGVIGGQNLSHALSSEFYPTGIRSTGVGWALGIGRVGSIVGPMVGGYLLATGGGATRVFWAAAIPAVIAATAAALISVRVRLKS